MKTKKDHISSYLETAKCYETWNSPQRNVFLDGVIAKIVPGKRVVETGTRSGLFCYCSFVHNCSFVIGLDLDPSCVSIAADAFHSLRVPSYKWNFIREFAENFDYTDYDVCLCLGVLYNVNDDTKNKILHNMNKIPISLVEFWCIEDDDPSPHTSEYQCVDNFIQYMPNKLQAELFLERHNYKFQEITPAEFSKSYPDHRNGTINNRFYICGSKKLGFL